LQLQKKALKNDIKNPELGIKLAKAYQRTNHLTLAKKTIDSLLKIDPNNTQYTELKKELK